MNISFPILKFHSQRSQDSIILLVIKYYSKYSVIIKLDKGDDQKAIYSCLRAVLVRYD